MNELQEDVKYLSVLQERIVLTATIDIALLYPNSWSAHPIDTETSYAAKLCVQSVFLERISK